MEVKIEMNRKNCEMVLDALHFTQQKYTGLPSVNDVLQKSLLGGQSVQCVIRVSLSSYKSTESEGGEVSYPHV
jgi:hypothetical protein